MSQVWIFILDDDSGVGVGVGAGTVVSDILILLFTSLLFNHWWNKIVSYLEN